MNGDDVRCAAVVLRQVSELYEYSQPQFGEWSESSLLAELPAIEEALAERELADDIALKIVGVAQKFLAPARAGGTPWNDFRDAVAKILLQYGISLEDDPFAEG